MRLTCVTILFCLLVIALSNEDYSEEDASTKKPESGDFAPYGALGYVLTKRKSKVCDPPCAPDQKCIRNTECSENGQCGNVCFPYTRRVWTSVW
ncbi:hypothetical protein L596_013856 [Steinernema carpocapsae]|uniref:WAP domain-containing protein n=1 Tax=Steinernema carpocapsae TaxID=34508 RepID=A0A4U5P1J6_STECR|nr:hypothetical protein L596_013856 [Steinernema carpocapsae]